MYIPKGPLMIFFWFSEAGKALARGRCDCYFSSSLSLSLTVTPSIESWCSPEAESLSF